MQTGSGADDVAGFEALLRVPDEEFDLARAALAIATDACPGLDPVRYLGRLDEMASTVESALAPGAETTDRLSAINKHLFGDLALRGNAEHYSDPRNSYLNEVLDRGLGIPISLSVIYLEVAWRLGLPCSGVSFPGHFLVKCKVHGGHVVLDPFNGGASLGEDDLHERLVGLGDREAGLTGHLAQFLASVPKRSILMRMLRNLKHVHLQAGRYREALPALDKMIALEPRSSMDLRDRGKVHERLEATRAALADYRAYLSLTPSAPDAVSVRARVEILEHRVRRLN